MVWGFGAASLIVSSMKSKSSNIFFISKYGKHVPRIFIYSLLSTLDRIMRNSSPVDDVIRPIFNGIMSWFLSFTVLKKPIISSTSDETSSASPASSPSAKYFSDMMLFKSGSVSPSPSNDAVSTSAATSGLVELPTAVDASASASDVEEFAISSVPPPVTASVFSEVPSVATAAAPVATAAAPVATAAAPVVSEVPTVAAVATADAPVVSEVPTVAAPAPVPVEEDATAPAPVVEEGTAVAAVAAVAPVPEEEEVGDIATSCAEVQEGLVPDADAVACAE